jgi:glycosyltransferase involved in cell wall biosynthesis
MVNKELSVCILGKDKEEFLPKCLKDALKMSREVIYVDLESDDQSKAKAIELGARVVDLDSLPSALQAEWVLFIKPEEKPVLSSVKKLQKMLMNKQAPGYGVYTNSTNTTHLVENYQWIKKLEQFKNTSDSAYVVKIEPRLVRKSLAEACLRALASNNTEEISWICGRIAEGICLKGKLTYDVTPEEDMVELSEMYTGFRILHKGQLDGFMEGARRGFGHIKMYIPFLDFLCKESFFEEAKNLFEQWVEHRSDDKENYNTQLMGGMIYSNLLEIDKAIEWFAKITETSESALAYANLGKLYLIKGDKEKAIEHLEISKDIEGDIFLKKKILSIIDKKEWHPLTLSLCMIVRDEETQIGKALESVKDIVDEIIVVDTGSSDRTREIIREFGGKVIETKWEHDFSKAKNVALEQATGDYILFMDADEFIDSRDRFALALFKKLLPIERNIAFGIKVEPAKESKSLSMSYLDKLLKRDEDDYQIRLFPRKGEIQFQGRVFESLDKTLKEKQVQALRNDMVKITHSMGGREQRDKRKIPAIAKSFDSIHDPQKTLKAGVLFLRLGDLDGALPWLIKIGEMNPELSAKIGALYSKQNKPEMAKDILTGALKQFPDSPELILSMAEVYYKEENYNEVINILANRIETIEKNLESEDAAKAVYYHGIASLETGNLGDGIEYLAFAHEKNPANILYKIAGIYAFAKADQWEEALNAADQIVDEEGIEIASEVNDFVDVGQVFVEMNRHFAQVGKIEEADLCQKIVEDVVKNKISGEENIQRMSAVIEDIGSGI